MNEKKIYVEGFDDIQTLLLRYVCECLAIFLLALVVSDVTKTLYDITFVNIIVFSLI